MLKIRRARRGFVTLGVIGSAVAMALPALAHGASWTLATGSPLGTARETEAGVVINETASGAGGSSCNAGDVLVAGGWDGTFGSGYLTSAVCLNPAALSTPRSPTSFMNTARWGHSLIEIPNVAGNHSACKGKVLAAGGYNTSGSQNSSEVYDPATNAWTTLSSSLATARNSHTTTRLDGTVGKVLVSGGFTNPSGAAAVGTSELFDPTSAAGCSWGSAASLSVPRGYHAAAKFSSGPAAGKVLACGGETPSPNGVTVHSSCELYDPATNTWSLFGAMSSPRSRHVAVAMPNGKILLAGGMQDSAFTPNNTSEECDSTGCGKNVKVMPLRGEDPTVTPESQPAAGSNKANALLLSAGSHSGGVLLCGGFTNLVGPYSTNGCGLYVGSGLTVSCDTGGATTGPSWCGGLQSFPPMTESRTDFVLRQTPTGGTTGLVVAAGGWSTYTNTSLKVKTSASAESIPR